jgi:uncharacterized membrane protein
MQKPVKKRLRPVALVHGLFIRPKLYIAITAAIVAWLILPVSISLAARLAVTWNTGGFVYLIITIWIMATCNAGHIRKRAELEDESALVFLLLVLVAIAVSFVAVIGLIGEAKFSTGYAKVGYLALAGLSIFVSWTVTQLVFSLHYAHAYYKAGGENDADGVVGGLRFPEDDHPDYWDFFYFTTSIGATSQTSDVAITSKPLRRLVAFQAIVSFAFNTTILALAINLAAGLI